MLPNGFRRRVGAVACCACQRPEDQGLVTGNDLDTTDTDAAGGEGARLVEAQAVHAGEDLDGGKFLDEHTAACQRRRPDREVHGRQEHQALRDHADHRGNREHEGLAPVSPVTAGDPILRVEGQNRTVHAHLIAERQIDDVVEHDVARWHNRQGAVTQDGRLRSIDDSERVEGSLGTELRHDADHRVDDHDATENAITQVTEQQHDDRRSDDDRVEQRQDVLADDRRHRPRGTVLHPVDRAEGDALGDLGGAQATLINRQAVSAHRHPPRP